MEERKGEVKSSAGTRSAKPSQIPRRGKTVPPSRTTVTAEERHQLIAKAAYLRAERRGFAPGSELEDWFEAEAEINGVLSTSDITPKA
jgi:hypothetical protein